MLGVWEYIESTRDKVRDLERRVRLAKANVEQMNNIMSGWSQSPLFRRKEDKKDTLLNLEVLYTFYLYLHVHVRQRWCKSVHVHAFTCTYVN